MPKTAPSFARLAVMVGFAFSCFGLLLYLWLAFGGVIPLRPQGYRFSVSLPAAAQLAKEADVRISGVPVGKVKALSLGPDGRTKAIIELKPQYAPLPVDAHAILRQKTLLGETYVELSPGTRRGPKVPDNGQLPTAQVANSVQLDEIFRAFDPRTREAFQTWMQSFAGSIQGRGEDLNSALGNLAPFADQANRLVSVLASQQGAVQQLVSNTGVVFDALSARDGQLRGLIQNAEGTFATTAARDSQLQDTFRVLPTFETQARQTFDRLTAFATNADPLITQLRPAVRQLSPTLVDLRAIAPDLKTLFQRLGPVINASGRGLPATDRILSELRPLLAQFDPTFRQLTPMISYLGLYRREIEAFFSNTVASTQAYDSPPGANGKRVHYLRTTNPINLENLAVFPRRLGSNRPNPYVLPGGFDRLAQHLQVFDNRSCGNGIPTLVDQASGIIPQPLIDLLKGLGIATNPSVPSLIPAPPCDQQAKFNFGGLVSQFPHVRQAP